MPVQLREIVQECIARIHVSKMGDWIVYFIFNRLGLERLDIPKHVQ